ncbi:uncharacterized protein ARB_06657 [Trichophyton benhamiae CBS 112371]|uniref:Uncharacterized protein n=1 Tax=Arthroderma benhamiae (strain ATCC MYA-4681 / CBS 112371) TaxID=663331 RepID=D4ARB7_ARTBC|nr:uncharacterized protein ARB_06657 [Trichophyton benhamiae CBS 112371]EFE34260.1 hypothetical protein ARB_06657 [Trichophyton benhamiae CBS 112371]
MVAKLYKGSRRREKKRDMALQEEEEKTTVKNRPLNCAVEVKMKKETRRTRQAKGYQIHQCTYHISPRWS